MTLQDFIEDYVGLTNSDLNYDEASLLHDANLFECEGGTGAPIPITYFGQIISWTCGTGNDFVPVGPQTLFEIGVLNGDLDACGDDVAFPSGEYSDEVTVADLFVLDAYADGDWTNIPGIGMVFIPNGDYIVKHATYGSESSSDPTNLATELRNIFF